MKKINLSILSFLICLAFQAKAQFPSADFNVNYGYLYGSEANYNTADDDFGGWVHDGNGNVYMIHANKTIDVTQSNVVITKMNISTGNIIWAKKYGSDTRGEKLVDPGSNGITVGGAGTSHIKMDSNGDLYFTCTIYNNFDRCYVAKVNPNTGAIIWQKSWKNANNELGTSSASSHALDVKGGKVFVVGTTDNKDLLLVYDASNGNHLSTSLLDPGSGADKVWAVKATNDGSTVYIAGWTSFNFQKAFIAKLTNSGSTFEWINFIHSPAASRVTDIEFDANGDIYLNIDVHGAQTYLQLVKLNPSGQKIWVRNFGKGVSNDRYNGMKVDIIDNLVYLSGRAGLNDNNTWVDTPGGDGITVVFDTAGAYVKNYYYFTGTNIAVQASDWVKGVLSYNGSLYFAGNIYPKSSNYTGNWYMAPNHADSSDVTFTFNTNQTFSTNFMGFDANLTMDVNDFTGYVKEDITNANGTTFGTTQVYLWKVTPTSTNRSNISDVKPIFSVFPNPASEKVFVLAPKNIQNFQVSILDITGKIIKSDNFDNTNNRSIDVSELTKGVYMVKLQNGDHLEVHKLIIQ